MRIGFDAHVLDGRSQGIKTLMLRLIDASVRARPGWEFFVYSDSPHPELDFTRPNLYHRETTGGGSVRRLLYTLPKAYRRDQLDTMVFNFIQSPLVRNATVMMHDVLPQTHPKYFSTSFVVRCWLYFGITAFFAKALFTISEYSQREIRAIYPWTRKKPIPVLHLGPSFAENLYFEECGQNAVGPIEANLQYVLVVGRIEERKNVQLAIEAFRQMPQKDVRLLIVGGCEPGVSLNSGEDVRIVHMGSVSDEDLISIYRNASLFLYPSAAEGFGLPLLDAILFGIPVISSRNTSMQDIGAGGATFFDPQAAGAVEWLSGRMTAHFGGERIAPATMLLRKEKAKLYSWRNAAEELLQGIEDVREPGR